MAYGYLKLVRVVDGTGTTVEWWDDSTSTYHNYQSGVDESRPYTPMEVVEAQQRVSTRASLTDIVARLERIEARLWPPVDPAAPLPSSVPTMEDCGGVWPAGQLLSDSGRVWRNVAGVPLTTAPSGFPGTPDQWSHLYVEVTGTTPTYPAWDPEATYAVGDHVTNGGVAWSCLIPHGPERQGTWEPGPATQGTVWALA